MKFFLFFSLLFLFISRSFGQTYQTIEIRGKVRFEQNSDSMMHKPVTILNNSTHKQTISNKEGHFSIEVKENDFLVFNAENCEVVYRKITKEDFKLGHILIIIPIKEVMNIDLKEVLINKYSYINAVNLGIIPRDQKKYTQAERKLYTANSSADGIFNFFSGRTNMLEKELAVEKKIDLYSKIEYMFDDNYYKDQLHIPSDYIKGFKMYCIEDSSFVKVLESKNRNSIMFSLTDLARQYLKIINNE